VSDHPADAGQPNVDQSDVDPSDFDQSSAPIDVLVVYASSPQAIWSKPLCLTAPATVAEVIARSGFEQSYPLIDWRAAGVGIFGRKCSADDLVTAGARIEIYRPLTFDPMQSRRRRAAHRKAQLLAKKKPRVKKSRQIIDAPSAETP
jgi:uncharacterized protein